MRRCLIVDDNREFAENLAEIIRDQGAEVDLAGGGGEALALVTRWRYQALLTDMRMPGMGGAELVHEVRRLDPGLAALVVTAHVADDTLEAARREGLLAVLAKPVPIGPLLELLSAARRDGLVAVIEDDPRLSDNLCEAMRRLGLNFPGLPVLIMTGVPAAPEAGAPAFFRKPFDTAALLAAVERLHAAQPGTGP